MQTEQLAVSDKSIIASTAPSLVPSPTVPSTLFAAISNPSSRVSSVSSAQGQKRKQFSSSVAVGTETIERAMNEIQYATLSLKSSTPNSEELKVLVHGIFGIAIQDTLQVYCGPKKYRLIFPIALGAEDQFSLKHGADPLERVRHEQEGLIVGLILPPRAEKVALVLQQSHGVVWTSPAFEICTESLIRKNRNSHCPSPFTRLTMPVNAYLQQQIKISEEQCTSLLKYMSKIEHKMHSRLWPTQKPKRLSTSVNAGAAVTAAHIASLSASATTPATPLCPLDVMISDPSSPSPSSTSREVPSLPRIRF